MNRITAWILRVLCLLGALLVAEATYFYIIQSRNPELEKADLIAVLPAAEERIQAGYEMARSGCAPNMTVVGVSEAELAETRRYQGFPGEVKKIFTADSSSTFEDALNIKRVVERYGFHSVILVTSSYHMPRAYFLLWVLLQGSGVDIYRHGVHTPGQAQASRVRGALLDRKVAYELVKFWGSTGEMLIYLMFGQWKSQ